MKSIPFEEAKAVELQILLCFVKFCDQHGLKYYLAYGTLLGAVRHQGFIPWDDDIDVQMPRDDYNRLIQLFNSNVSVPYYKLIDPLCGRARHPFVKIIDERTIKLESGVDYSNGTLGIDIDVFPVDGQPLADDCFEKWYRKLQKLYRTHSYCIMTNEGRLRRRIGVPVIRFLSGGRIRVLRKTKTLHDKYPYEKAEYVGAVESSFNSRGNRSPKSLYESTVLLPFEGYDLKAPVGYKSILQSMYGDFMTLPPAEKQVTHHVNKMFWRDECYEEEV